MAFFGKFGESCGKLRNFDDSYFIAIVVQSDVYYVFGLYESKSL